MSKKRLYMMAPFRDGALDQDIREKYFAIPEGKRSDALRDAFRLWCGIDKKLVFEATEKPLRQPDRPPYIQKPNAVHACSKPVNRPLMNTKK